ncbi:MAG: hypothetical protein DRK00_00610 [Thermoprotei archaeon]|nr:MAG: hypothetical protein DRK00_00610 [Thermoprotei archaeon]
MNCPLKIIRANLLKGRLRLKGVMSVRYKLLAVDVDGVLTKVNSVWRYLHECLDTLGEAAINAALFREGKITYEEWAKLDASLWKGVRVEEIMRVVSGVELREGAAELVKLVRERGLEVVALSAGLSLIADRVAAELEIDACLSNELIVRDGVVTGDVVVRVTCSNKGDLLLKICSERGVEPDQVVVIGDSEADIPMMRVSGLAIAYNPSSPLVLSCAHLVIISETLRPVVALLDKLTR